MNTTRREFLNNVGLASVAMSAASGCATKPSVAPVAKLAAGAQSLVGAPTPMAKMMTLLMEKVGVTPEECNAI